MSSTLNGLGKRLERVEQTIAAMVPPEEQEEPPVVICLPVKDNEPPVPYEHRGPGYAMRFFVPAHRLEQQNGSES